MIHVHAGTCICMFSFVWVGVTSLPIISSCAMHIFSHMRAIMHFVHYMWNCTGP